VVGGTELGVVLEEEGGDGLVDVAGFFGLGELDLFLFRFELVGFDAGVFGGDYFFGDCEFTRFFLLFPWCGSLVGEWIIVCVCFRLFLFAVCRFIDSREDSIYISVWDQNSFSKEWK